MKPKDFYEKVEEGIRKNIHSDLANFSAKGEFGLLKIFYVADKSIHYEVWIQRRSGLLELGLHFEGERDTNYKFIDFMSEHALEVQAEFGERLDFEYWTRSWTRIHQMLPLRPLEDNFAQEVANKMRRLVEACEPLVRELQKKIRS